MEDSDSLNCGRLTGASGRIPGRLSGLECMNA